MLFTPHVWVWRKTTLDVESVTPTLRNLSDSIPREIVTTQVCHHMVSEWDRAVQVMNYCILAWWTWWTCLFTNYSCRLSMCIYACVQVTAIQSLQWTLFLSALWKLITTSSIIALIMYVCMYVHTYVCVFPGVDQTREAWGNSLASGEISPCCLLSQLWRGESPPASYWRSG